MELICEENHESEMFCVCVAKQPALRKLRLKTDAFEEFACKQEAPPAPRRPFRLRVSGGELSGGRGVGADLGWRRRCCRWRWASPPPLPLGARRWLSPCCWPTCCASSCPRSWVWRPAGAGLLHLAAERWARLEASECRKSYLKVGRH